MEMCYGSKGIDNYIQVNGGTALLDKAAASSYRLRMIENNDIEGLIRPITMEMDGSLILKYNTCSYYVLDRLFLKFKPDGGFLKILMEQLEKLFYRLKSFLLVPDDLVLKPEYMFYNWGDKALKLIYIPGYGKNIKEQLKQLLEYIMKIFDHRDDAGVRYMYGMYDLISEDTFSMEDFKFELERENTPCAIEEAPMENEYVALQASEKQVTKLVPLTSGSLGEITISKYDEMIIVGRGKKETDYRIPTTQISRVHACIYIRNNGIYVEDRESTNGTYINSVRLEPLHQEKIQVGDLINFANEEFFVV